MSHLCVHDLERYHLGMVQDEAELAVVEEHLLACPQCVGLAEEAADYVDCLRAAIVTGNFDLELDAKDTPQLQLKQNGPGRTRSVGGAVDSSSSSESEPASQDNSDNEAQAERGNSATAGS
jgi:hypothetical protein